MASGVFPKARESQEINREKVGRVVLFLFEKRVDG